jgi:uncharacterized membrane protein YfhO
MLGVHKLVREGRFQLYVLSLSLAIIFNFYIGVFICIFTAIWFFALCYVQKLSRREFLKKLLYMATFSALAIGITAFITLPAYKALQQTFAAIYGNQFPDALQLRHSFFDILGNFVAFMPPTVVTGLPNLASGMVSVMLLPVFLLSQKISRKEKLAYALVTAFMVVSTNVNVLDYMWHGFSYPTGLPARYSFLISFVLVVMAYRAFLLVGELRKRDIVAIAGATALFLIMATLGQQEMKHVVWSAVLSGAYLCLFIWAYINKDKSTLRLLDQEKKLAMVKLVFFAVIIIELMLSSYIGVKTVGTKERENYPPQYSSMQELLDKRQPMENDFYRTDSIWRWSYNDTSLYGYEGISVWANTINAGATNFMEGIGLTCSTINNSYYYVKTSPLTDAFLNMRYCLDYNFKPSDSSIFWRRLAAKDGVYLLENNYHLPLGFMVNEETAGYRGFAGIPYRSQYDAFGRVVASYAEMLNKESFIKNGSPDTPFSAQNDLFHKATGLEGNLFSTFDCVNIESDNCKILNQEPGKYTFTALNKSKDSVFIFDYEMPLDGCLYLYVWVEGAGEARIALENQALHDIVIYNPYIYYAGSFRAGDLVSVAAQSETHSGEIWIYAAVIDQTLFKQGFAMLADEVLELTEFTDTKINGNITVLEDGLLYTSIPHAGLWRAFVDGNEAEITTIDGAMAALNLSAGYHTIEFRYHNSSLITGIIISVIAVLLFMVLIVKKTFWPYPIFPASTVRDEKRRKHS